MERNIMGVPKNPGQVFRSSLVIIMMFFSSICFAQSLRVIGRIPRPNSEKLYRIQVGAFREIANAERAFNRLRNAGLNPVYENYLNYRRVILAGISANNVPRILNTVSNARFLEVWISEERASSSFNIITDGNGAVSVISDFADNEPLAIVQTIPSFRVSGSTDGTNTYPLNAPVVFSLMIKFILIQ